MLTDEERSQVGRHTRSSSKSSCAPRRFHSASSCRHNSRASRASTFADQSPEGNHHARLGEYAARLWLAEAMTDVMVVVQNKEFKAHKAVLACYSPYFKEVLLKPGANTVHYLEIPCVTAQAFEILLTYMYTGEIKVTCQDLAEVYRAARRLGMKDALNKCLEMLTVSAQCLENTIYLYVTAKKLDLLEPSLRAFKLMLIHFEPLVATQEFLNLEVEQVVDFFSADEIGARSEVIVYLAALNWLNYKFLDREPHINAVMSCVRFCMMTLEEVLTCHHPPLLPAIVLYPAVKDALFNATCYVAAKTLDQDSLFKDLACSPRKYMLEGQPAVLWDFRSLYDSQLYPEYRDRTAATRIQASFRGYRARKHLEEDTKRRNSAAIVIQSAFRGYNTRKCELPFQNTDSSSTFAAAEKRLSWETPTHDLGDKMFEKSSGMLSPSNPMMTRLGSGSIISNSTSLTKQIPDSTSSEITSNLSDLSKECVKNVVYAIGGFDMEKGTSEGNGILCYCPTSNFWKDIGNIPEPRHDIRIVLLNGFLYCIGGCDPRTINTNQMVSRRECYKYQLDKRKWLPMTSLITGRVFHGAAVLNNIIYVVGGKDDKKQILSSIEGYDVASNVWTEVGEMTHPRMGMGVASYGGSLWVSGGLTNQGKKLVLVDSVESYNPQNSRWSQKAKLPLPTAFMSLVKCREKLFSVGGAVQSSAEKCDLTSITSVHFYDSRSCSWKQATNLPIPLHSVIATSLKNDIYVLGGYSAQKMAVLKEVFYFDSVNRRWRPCCHLPASACGYVFAAIGSEATN